MELPKSIGNLNELTVLNVDRNSLGDIPTDIGNMTLLGVLSLRDNKLTRLPNELGNCKSLHVLDVSGNRYDSSHIFLIPAFRLQIILHEIL